MNIFSAMRTDNLTVATIFEYLWTKMDATVQRFSSLPYSVSMNFNLINGASDFPSVAVLWYQKIGFLPVQVAHY